MLGPLAFLCALLFPGGVAAFSVEQHTVAVGHVGSYATLSCKASNRVNYMHWYLHQEGSAPKWIFRLELSTSSVHSDGGFKADKVNATCNRDSNTCNLSIQRLEKSDEGVYYCAAWEYHSCTRCSAP